MRLSKTGELNFWFGAGKETLFSDFSITIFMVGSNFFSFIF